MAKSTHTTIFSPFAPILAASFLSACASNPPVMAYDSEDVLQCTAYSKDDEFIIDLSSPSTMLWSTDQASLTTEFIDVATGRRRYIDHYDIPGYKCRKWTGYEGEIL